jgi:nucleotide-binding universal stress UspA family protein
MKILLAADGSSYTKKALAFLVTHEGLAGTDGELVVLHVQAPMPDRVKTMVGAAAVNGYYRDESQKVLSPIERFLKRHDVPFRTTWTIGPPAAEVIKAATREKAQLIVMGTHGHGLLGRALIGSVAQSVLTHAAVPVLLVK